MDTRTQHYTSPAQPPRLVTRRVADDRPHAAAPLLVLRGSSAEPPRPLISFGWSRVAPSRNGR